MAVSPSAAASAFYEVAGSIASLPQLFGQEAAPTIERLTEALYAQVYCRLPMTERAASEGAGSSKSTATLLRAAWTVGARLDWRWEIRDKEASGAVLASVGQRVVFLPPGDYLTADEAGQIGILTDQITKDGEWVFVRAGLAGLSRGGELRFYFNLCPEGLEAIGRLLTRLHAWGVSFAFKAPRRFVDFRRPDAAVLYCQREEGALVWALVHEALGDLQKFLRVSTPPFARLVAQGVGLAESPPDGASFGWSRMAICAGALLDSPRADVTAPGLGKELVRAFAALGIDPAEPFRNQNTRYPYDRTFPGWDTT